MEQGARRAAQGKADAESAAGGEPSPDGTGPDSDQASPDGTGGPSGESGGSMSEEKEANLQELETVVPMVANPVAVVNLVTASREPEIATETTVVEEKVPRIKTLMTANVSVNVLMQRWKRSMVPVKPVSLLTRVRNKMWRRKLEQAKQDAIDALEAAKEAADKDQENGHMTPTEAETQKTKARLCKNRGINATRTTDQSNRNGGPRSRSPC